MRTKALVPMLAFAATLIGAACSNPPTSTNMSNASNKPVNAAPTNTNAAPAIAALPGMDEATHAAFKAKCALCHGQDGKGGKGPNLLELKDKHTADEWEAYLKDPKTFEKDNEMPALPMEDSQRKLLAAWLAKTAGAPAADAAADGMPKNAPASDAKKF